ncbi:unnamed protein product [Toxocara canis]|uniref:Transcriptional repressor rco-1 n=1 Tax=Toxocara canis TaxID=6265 RepID=A0A183V3Y0_TOXCA|nr:unnamed protein product [Toxocara canis]
MNGSHAKDVGLGGATEEVTQKENSIPASPKKFRNEASSSVERKKERNIMETDESRIASSGGEQEDGEVSDGSNAALADDDGEIVDDEPMEKNRHRSIPAPPKVEEEPEITKKSAFEKLKNMKFSSRSKVSVGSSSVGRSSSPRRENDEERRLRKRRWEDHSDEDRQATRNVDRARPLRDTVSPVMRPPEPTRPVDQPSTLRQRIERIVCLSEAEVANLSDAELRSLIARMFEIDREQQRLYKGRRAQIETLQEMFMQAKDDVERLLKCLPAHMKADIPPLPSSLPIFQSEPAPVPAGVPLPAQVNGGICVPPPGSTVPSVFAPPPGVAAPASVIGASNGPAPSAVAGPGASVGAQPQPPIAYSAVNGPSAAQATQEFGPSVSQPSSSGAPSFPVAPSLLNRPPSYGMAAGMPSTNTTAAPPPFINMPPPTTVPGQQPPHYGTPVSSASFARLPPAETVPSSSSFPNLSQPPPSIVTPASGNMPPPDFSMPPPASLSSSSVLSGDSAVSASKTSVATELSSSTSSLTSSSNVVTTATVDSEPSSVAAPTAAAPSTPLPPPVNLSVPPPNFPLPPPRIGSDGLPPFSGPPPVPNTTLPPPGRGPIPQGPPPGMIVGPPPSMSSGPPPTINIPVAPPVGGPPNLSCPPPNMSCPPPNIRPPVNLGNPQSVHQMVSAIVSRSAASGQTPVEVVTELIANAYNRGAGFGPMVPSAASGPPSRMSVPPPGLGPPMPGPPPNMGGPPPMGGGSNKLPTVNLSTGAHSRNVGTVSFRSFSGPGGGQARFGNRGQQQQQSQQQRRQISDMVAIIPDEHDMPDSREHHDDSNIFLIVSDEEDSGK